MTGNSKEGLYGVIRHPQYAGIMLAVFGQIVHWPNSAIPATMKTPPSNISIVPPIMP